MNSYYMLHMHSYMTSGITACSTRKSTFSFKALVMHTSGDNIIFKYPGKEVNQDLIKKFN